MLIKKENNHQVRGHPLLEASEPGLLAQTQGMSTAGHVER